MSPVFETEIDRAHESEILSIIEDYFEVKVETTSTLADVDFYGYAGTELQIVGEIKYRKVRSDQYGHAYFDAYKARKLSAAASEYYATGIVVLRYTDGLFYMLVTDVQSFPTRQSSRTDRGGHDKPQSAHLIPPHMLRRIL